MKKSAPSFKASKNHPSLKSGRPPLLTAEPTSRKLRPHVSKASSRTTRTVIRAHHNLHKSRAKALAEGNDELVASLDAEIDQLGGLNAYQAASLTGQSKDRGGDSSTVLVKWLEEAGLITGKTPSQTHQNPTSTKTAETSNTRPNPSIPALRVLEIGALSSTNAISSTIGKGIASVTRIDLKSQEPGLIQEIDFMEFPVPDVDRDRYDVISLSLVLNYVPEARGRGEMLKRTRGFLRGMGVGGGLDDDDRNEIGIITPCLFLVLPLPCVANSRYMTISLLHDIMTSLGYMSVQMRQSAKLHYELFRYLGSDGGKGREFRKTEVNPGGGRNNFCVTVERGG